MQLAGLALKAPHGAEPLAVALVLFPSPPCATSCASPRPLGNRMQDIAPRRYGRKGVTTVRPGPEGARVSSRLADDPPPAMLALAAWPIDQSVPGVGSPSASACRTAFKRLSRMNGRSDGALRRRALPLMQPAPGRRDCGHSYGRAAADAGRFFPHRVVRPDYPAGVPPQVSEDARELTLASRSPAGAQALLWRAGPFKRPRSRRARRTSGWSIRSTVPLHPRQTPA